MPCNNNKKIKKIIITGITSSHTYQKPSRFSLGGKGIWHKNQPRGHVEESSRPARESAGSPLMCCSPKIIHGSNPLSTNHRNTRERSDTETLTPETLTSYTIWNFVS